MGRKGAGYGYNISEKLLYSKNKKKRVRVNSSDTKTITAKFEFQWLAYSILFTYGYYSNNMRVMVVAFILTALTLLGKSMTKEEE